MPLPLLKAKCSQVVEQAVNGTPQHVTRRGKPAVVVVSIEEWEARSGKGPTAWDIFKDAPKFDDDFELDLERGVEIFPDRELNLELD
ncbi:type II toxin-antitoxin system prevent-host-death family antitoxin [Deinococcus xinjiangensis]|uniref:type II toxin-antitoxin system prevent-host-death family antitoxin n=1 Tax=Deinococcus xinjiangensis TaxID=457454 RepID=UPI00336587E9